MNKEAAKVQSFVYARAYAIQPIPPTFDLDGANYVFVSPQGETEWPSDALHFDSVEEAKLAIDQLRIPKVVDRKTGEEYPMVVEMTLESKIRKVEVKTERVEVSQKRVA
jgi:hypothetical protein